jgi:omega-6 fatty acid desaturase (delta-12 desaturase)
VPAALKYFTAGIEYHNVHHLNTRVPLYKIQACFEEAGPIFDGVPTFTMWDALKRLPYSLRHDEDLTFVSCYDE